MSNKQQTEWMIGQNEKYGKGDGIDINPSGSEASSSLNSRLKEEDCELKGDGQLKPLVFCERSGCANAAIVHPDWDGDFCSRDCALLRCREIFYHWVCSQKNGKK